MILSQTDISGEILNIREKYEYRHIDIKSKYNVPTFSQAEVNPKLQLLEKLRHVQRCVNILVRRQRELDIADFKHVMVLSSNLELLLPLLKDYYNYESNKISYEPRLDAWIRDLHDIIFDIVDTNQWMLKTEKEKREDVSAIFDLKEIYQEE